MHQTRSSYSDKELKAEYKCEGTQIGKDGKTQTVHVIKVTKLIPLQQETQVQQTEQ